MTRTALALSPHLDDAAFSCGGTLAALARTGWRVVLATLFTRSMPDPRGFALACQLDKGLPASVDYMALRREEDRAAARALGPGVIAVHGLLPEAPHRGYESAPALFAAVREDDAIGPSLVAALQNLMDEWRPDLVLAPQAIGGHVDHVQLVQALEAIAPPAPVLWWRDFPYTSRSATPAEPFHDAMAARPDHRVTLDTAAREARDAACLCYASQLGFQFGGPEGLRAMLAQTGAEDTFRVSGSLPGDIRSLVAAPVKAMQSMSFPALPTT